MVLLLGLLDASSHQALDQVAQTELHGKVHVQAQCVVATRRAGP